MVQLDQNKAIPYEIQRKAFLQQADMLFVAAHMQGLLARGASPDAAYAAALDIAQMYETLYTSQDRRNHTLQHPRVQILDDEGIRALEAIPKPVPAVGSAPYRTQVMDLAKHLNPDMAEALRLQDRHDCIYYFANGDANTDQHIWMKNFVGKRLVDVIGMRKPFNFTVTIPSTSITLGELAAVCMFSDENKNIEWNANLDTQLGRNEMASAIHAINQENAFRHAHGIGPMNAKEILTVCVTLAATIPFQKPYHLNQLAHNVYDYLEHNAEMRSALGVRDDEALKRLVDKIVYSAGKLANRDGSLGDKDYKGLYWANISVEEERQGIAPPITDPVERFRFHYTVLESQLSAEERGSDRSGYIYGLAEAGREGLPDADQIFHDFTPLSGDERYKIEDAQRLHAQYFANRSQVLPMHRADLLYACLEAAAQLRRERFSLERSQINENAADEFMRGTEGIEIIKLMQSVSSVAELRVHEGADDFNRVMKNIQNEVILRGGIGY